MLTWLVGSALLFSCLVCKAETKVPCFILSGNAEKEHCIDLAKLNRITFNDGSMVFSSSQFETEQSVELLFSLYHHIEIGDAVPSPVLTGFEGMETDSDARIYIDAQARLLYLQSASDSEFSVGVFNVSGHLLLTSRLNNGDSVAIGSLAPGVYFAVASDGRTKLSIKFILE